MNVQRKALDRIDKITFRPSTRAESKSGNIKVHNNVKGWKGSITYYRQIVHLLSCCSRVGIPDIGTLSSSFTADLAMNGKVLDTNLFCSSGVQNSDRKATKPFSAARLLEVGEGPSSGLV